MARLWSREEPQFFNIHGLDWVPSREVRVLDGVETRLLSSDEDRTSTTTMARLPAGWDAVESGEDATVEFFVLEGDLEINGDTVGAGGYAFIPRGAAGDTDLRSVAGAQVIVFSNALMAKEHGAEIVIRRLWKEPWNESVMPTALHGAMHKSMRLPDVGDQEVHGGPGGVVRVVILTPGFLDAREHVHDVWEEMLFLGGDLLMPDRGILAPGSYLGNPAEFWHAPMITQRASVMLLQTTAPIDMVIRDYPGGQEMAEAYLDGESWLAQPEHQDWAAISHYHPPG
jgi:hypothetical protein